MIEPEMKNNTEERGRVEEESVNHQQQEVEEHIDKVIEIVDMGLKKLDPEMEIAGAERIRMRAGIFIGVLQTMAVDELHLTIAEMIKKRKIRSA